MTGPSTADSPASPVNRPIALARSCGAYMTWMLDSTCGIIAAAASPCSARNPMSASAFGASPQAADISGEPDQPDDEDPLAAPEVTEPRTGDEADGEGQRVCGDHPLQLGGGRAAARSRCSGERR